MGEALIYLNHSCRPVVVVPKSLILGFLPDWREWKLLCTPVFSVNVVYFWVCWLTIQFYALTLKTCKEKKKHFSICVLLLLFRISFSSVFIKLAMIWRWIQEFYAQNYYFFPSILDVFNYKLTWNLMLRRINNK